MGNVQMAKEGTQYSEPGFSLTWPRGGKPESKAAPENPSTALASRIAGGAIVESAGRAKEAEPAEKPSRVRGGIKAKGSGSAIKAQGSGSAIRAGGGPVAARPRADVAKMVTQKPANKGARKK